MIKQAQADLADANRLRVGINLGNLLLVNATDDDGSPQGVAPAMAAALANCLGVEVSYITYATPGEVADAVSRDEWDVGLIAIDAERAESIDFCGAYVEIEATYLVPAGSSFRELADVDQPGVEIAVSSRSAYDLYLSRHLKLAKLRRAQGLAGALALFTDEKLDALAGLVPALSDNAANLPGSRLLAGAYTTVRQAFGCKPESTALQAFTQAFISEAISSGLVAELIERHGVAGKLQVATNS